MKFLKSLIPAYLGLCSLSFAGAEDENRKFPVTVNVAYASQYMTHGFDVGDDEPNLQSTILAGLANTGFSLEYWNSIPLKSDQTLQEHDLTLLYSVDLEVREFTLNLHGLCNWWISPENNNGQGVKSNLGVTLPDLLEIAGDHLAISYDWYYWSNVPWGNRPKFTEGAQHRVSLAWSYNEFQWPINLGSTFNYHEGAFDVDSGYSHTTFAVSTVADLGLCNLIPSVNYQWSHEDTVDPENELWVTISLGRTF